MNPQKLKCLTVDDEQGAHLVMKNYIGRVESLELVGMCFDALEAVNFLHKNTVDILFLDINMPEITGLEMLKTLANPPKVILTTAYSEFALESYEYGVEDYLIKPIPFPRFLKAVNRIIEDTKKEPVQVPVTPSMEPETYFFIQAEGGQVRIDFKDIMYIQSWGNYIKIFTTQTTHLATMTTQEVEERLPTHQFLRIHRSFLIAIPFINKVAGNQIYMGKTALPIGTTFRQKVFESVQ
jgi:DNA-binding LytR/AlgR family response regulator